MKVHRPGINSRGRFGRNAKKFAKRNRVARKRSAR